MLPLLVAVVAWYLLNSTLARQGQPTSPNAIGNPGVESARADHAVAGPRHAPIRVAGTTDTVVREGVEVAFSVKPTQSMQGATGGLADDAVEVSFVLTDATTRKPFMPETRPAVWVDLEKADIGNEGRDAPTCQDKIRLYAQGTVGFRPDVDLNSYLILALNSDATISVIDPLLSVGNMTQLYAMVVLKSPGEDWVLSRDQKRLFVTMPQANQIAVVDTNSFKVLATVDAGSNPFRIALQPDGRYLWVGNDSPDAQRSGVTIIDTDALRAVAQIRTGAGLHQIAFSHDAATHAQTAGDYAIESHDHSDSGTTRYAFVTNSREGTVSVIDAWLFKKIADIRTGGRPAAIDFSTKHNTIFVADEADGTITVIDGGNRQIIDRIKASPGISTLRFAPGGRWGFAVSTRNDVVDIVDASANRVVNSVIVRGEPDKVSFTDGHAYVRATKTPDVSLISLAQVGQPGELAIVQIIGGQSAPGGSPHHSVADAIAPVHEHGNHVLIANPADSYVYYYMEGMKAPMGGFQNYGRVPRAVQVVDRAMRETAPGTYSARLSLTNDGEYQVAFLLDTPRIVHCFSFRAAASSTVTTEDDKTPVTVRILSAERSLRVGEGLTLRFALTESQTNTPVSGSDDVYVMATLASGLWTDRFRAMSLGAGIYEVHLTPPRAGVYTIQFASAAPRMVITQPPSISVTVTSRDSPDP